MSRIGIIKKKLRTRRPLRFMEAHNGLAALLVDGLKIPVEGKGKKKFLEFDGFWESSFTDSASKGLPDIEVVSMDSRLSTINQIMEVTKKPMIVDGDTGGEVNQFEYTVRRLEKAGVSMVVIEDKVFPKRNSLEPDTKQELEKPELFAEKLSRGRSTKKDKDFMLVARLESLIAGAGIKDALERAVIYLKAGADGILIHSKKDTPDEVLEFAKRFKRLPKELTQGKALCCIPTTYNTITEAELARAGFNIIIYANHLLRASYSAMEKAARDILLNGRAFETEPYIAPVRDVFAKVGFLAVKEKDKQLADKLGLGIKTIVAAAGQDALSEKYQKPKCLLEVGGKTILARQLEVLKAAGLNKFIVIRGYKAEQFHLENVKYVSDRDFQKKYILNSLLCAQNEMDSPFIFLYGDLLFRENIIGNLLKAAQRRSEADIILIVDNSFRQHRERVNRVLDVVIVKNKTAEPAREIMDGLEEEVSFIGSKKIKNIAADYEFMGIAYFSQRGSQILKDVYGDCLIKYSASSFHEAANIHKADLTDILQEIVERGYKVRVLKTFKGWMEIDSEEDLKLARKIYKDEK